MDILGAVVNLVTGGLGGNIAGNALKKTSLGTLGNTIAGAVGGVAGNYILQAVGVLSSLGLADMSLESMGAHAGMSAVFGAVVTAVVGFLKNKSS